MLCPVKVFNVFYLMDSNQPLVEIWNWKTLQKVSLWKSILVDLDCVLNDHVLNDYVLNDHVHYGLLRYFPQTGKEK